MSASPRLDLGVKRQQVSARYASARGITLGMLPDRTRTAHRSTLHFLAPQRDVEPECGSYFGPASLQQPSAAGMAVTAKVGSCRPMRSASWHFSFQVQAGIQNQIGLAQLDHVAGRRVCKGAGQRRSPINCRHQLVAADLAGQIGHHAGGADDGNGYSPLKVRFTFSTSWLPRTLSSKPLLQPVTEARSRIRIVEAVFIVVAN